MTTDIAVGNAEAQCQSCAGWVFAHITHEPTTGGVWIKFTCPACDDPNQIFDDGTPDPDIDHDERANQ